jgi:cysteine-rich repeat protein
VAGGGRGRYCVQYLPVCGNGIVDPDEACDDGNTVGGDRCSADCRSNETCGNGVKDPGEVCDDRNTRAGDGCSADCRSDETCGNGVKDLAEECDDHNTTGGDGCEPDCTVSACGNGRPTEPEACDDGASGATTGCDSQCRIFAVGGTSLLSRYPKDSMSFIGGLVASSAPGGKLFVSWATGSSDRTIPPRVALTSADGGQHWQARRSFDSPESSGIAQRLLRGTAPGQLVLWWPASFGIKLRRSADSGVTWGAVESITIPGFNSQSNMDMFAVGSVWSLTWADRDGNNHANWYLRSNDAGATWTKPLRIDDRSLPPQQTCTSQVGIVAAAGSNDIFVSTCNHIVASHDGGLTFRQPAVVPVADDLWGLDPTRAVAAGPGVFLIPSTYWSLVWRTTDGFKTLTRMQLGSVVEGGPADLAREANGTLLWVWREKFAGGEEAVVLRRSVDQGQTWSPSTTVASVVRNDFLGGIGSAGVAVGPVSSYVWWYGYETGVNSVLNGRFRMRPTTDGGLTFGTAFSVSKPNVTLSTTISFLPDSEGGLHVFWLELTNPTPNRYFLYQRRL